MERYMPRSPPPPSTADFQFKHAKDPQAVKDLWFGLAGLLTFLVVVRIFRFAVLLLLKPSYHHDQGRPGRKEEETATTQPERASLCGRIFSALVSSFRQLAFRYTISIGKFSASACELGIIAIYMAANFLVLFIDSEFLIFR